MRILLVLFFATQAWALPEPADIGVGLVVGTFGAVETKLFLTDSDAVQAGIEFMDRPWSVAYLQYTRHFRYAFGGKNRFSKETTPYLGGGIGAGFWNRSQTCGRWNCEWDATTTGTGNGIFVRLAMGLEWFTRRWPLGIFAEAVPSYLWYPTNKLVFDAGAGIRFYF